MAQPRKFAGNVLPLNYVDAVAVTPSDDTDLAVAADALWVGVAGNVTVITLESTTTTFTVTAGTLLPIGTSRVKATGTNSTGVVALYL